MDNITELTELIFAGAKQVIGKIYIPLRDPDKKKI